MVEDEFDDYDVEEDGAAPISNRTDAIIQAAAERAVRASKTQRPPRPRAPKFGATTLLGSKGFKLLRQFTNKHMQYTDDPVRDLDSLMKIYREWTHAMYPKFQFRDTIDKVERHCRTAPMKAYLAALWRAQEEEHDFDELNYTAEQDANEAMVVLENINATMNPSAVPTAEQ